MRVISVNVGKERPIQAKSGMTGIYKEPSADAVYVGPEGLADDVVADKANHGGVDQAVYLYGEPDYAWWSKELKRALKPGTFGENVTISELESAALCVGDRLHVGGTVLEVTAPRIPCATLAARMEDPGFGKRFVAAERFGAYCRVLCAGEIRAGDNVTIIEYAGARTSIVELARSFFTASSEAHLRRLLALPIGSRARQYYEGKLRKAAEVQE